MWKVLDSGIGSAEENMCIDAELLEALRPGSEPVLHFYDWAGDCATFGMLVEPAEFLDVKKAAEMGLSLARRSTGGGIVFHLWDLAFSVAVPADYPGVTMNTLDNYEFINRRVMRAVEEFMKRHSEFALTESDAAAFDASCRRFCMAQPTKYDVVSGGRKIAGAAQRKRKYGFLHQGTIALEMPSEDYLKKILLPGTRVLEAMRAFTQPLLGLKGDLQAARKELRTLLRKYITEE